MTLLPHEGGHDSQFELAGKRERGAFVLVHERQFQETNDSWSKITIHGRGEYVDKALRFTAFKRKALLDEMSDQMVRMSTASERCGCTT